MGCCSLPLQHHQVPGAGPAPRDLGFLSMHGTGKCNCIEIYALLFQEKHMNVLEVIRDFLNYDGAWQPGGFRSKIVTGSVLRGKKRSKLRQSNVLFAMFCACSGGELKFKPLYSKAGLQNQGVSASASTRVQIHLMYAVVIALAKVRPQ